MKPLNPTNSSFEVLRTSGAVYVDKTRQLQDMISLDGGYFFSCQAVQIRKNSGRQHVGEHLQKQEGLIQWVAYRRRRVRIEGISCDTHGFFEMPG